MYFLIFRYKRVFSIGSKAITTYNPSNLEVTNQVSFLETWHYYGYNWLL